jgi:hypothetical protein
MDPVPEVSVLQRSFQSGATANQLDDTERHDNLLCAVLVLEDRVVVKTVMHHFTVL